MALKRPSSEDGNTSDTVAQWRSRSRTSAPLDPVEEWQRLFQAAERRKVQNRNAQRRYRQSLKKRLDSLELNGAYLGAVSSGASSTSSQSSTFNVDTRGRSISNCSIPTMSSLAGAQQDQIVIPDAQAHRRHWSTSCLPGGSSTTPFILNNDMGFSIPAFDQSVLNMSQQPMITLATYAESMMEPIMEPVMETPTSDPAFSTYQHSGLSMMSDMSTTPPHVGQDNLFAPGMAYSSSSSTEEQTPFMSQPTTPPKNPFMQPTGANPLHLAAMRGSVPILAMLIERGADVNEADERGCTALHLACEHSQAEAANILLDHGADLTAKIPLKGQESYWPTSVT